MSRSKLGHDKFFEFARNRKQMCHLRNKQGKWIITTFEWPCVYLNSYIDMRFTMLALNSLLFLYLG